MTLDDLKSFLEKTPGRYEELMSESHWGYEGEELQEDIKRLEDDIDWRNEETNQKYC